MLHAVLIGIHAALGAVAFVAGFVAIRRGTLFDVHLWTLVGTIVFLAAAMVVRWPAWSTGERIVFSVLLGLGCYMLLRGAQAARARPGRAQGISTRYVEHMGFNLVALFDAFVVVLVLDLGGPVWLMVTVGVAVAVTGHLTVCVAKLRLTSGRGRPSPC
ncbi:hypothetical protein DVS77_27630 [Mycolicibacterium moriokaense]|nr:hypothetical protein DVS77_27630 [Mycolicibacterium moriokaense]